MSFIKRVSFFVITNIAVVFLLIFILHIVQLLFWVSLVWNTDEYLWLIILCLIYWFLWSFVSLFISKYLAKKAYNITLYNDSNISDPKIWHAYSIVKEIANSNKIRIPEFWVYDSYEMNAFATWPSKNSSLVAVSSWLLNNMDNEELEWVLWHEMAHIINWDMVTMVLLQWIMNAFVLFLSRVLSWIIVWLLSKWKNSNSNWWMYYFIVFLLEIVLWVLWTIIVMRFSRFREYKADKWSAYIVWKEKMIKALEKLRYKVNYSNDSDDLWDISFVWKLSNDTTKTLKINWLSSFFKLFSSHPDLEDRIRRLKSI